MLQCSPADVPVLPGADNARHQSKIQPAMAEKGRAVYLPGRFMEGVKGHLGIAFILRPVGFLEPVIVDIGKDVFIDVVYIAFILIHRHYLSFKKSRPS